MVFLNCQLVLMSFNFNEYFQFRCWVSVNIISLSAIFFAAHRSINENMSFSIKDPTVLKEG